VEGIRELVQGGSVFDPQVTRSLATGRKGGGASAAANRLGALTSQERCLLAEIAKGKTDKEVAAEMGLTPKTARNYLERVFTKLNVRNRTEAALLYVREVERDL
jgi:two-component system response regulator DevR